MNTITGHATSLGTRAFSAAFLARPGFAPDFYTNADDLMVSSVGLGTYLGETDAATDQGYEDAIAAALSGGINHIDTAVNYRGMASERAVGRALAAACGRGVARQGLLVATKAGYFPRDVHTPTQGGRALLEALIAQGRMTRADVAKGDHCLAPGFLEYMLATSLHNLGLDCVDIFYLHNPEAQLAAGVSRPLFNQRCRAAFAVLEAARRRGAIRAYGTATWSGYRVPAGSPSSLVLEDLVALAKEAAGTDDHGFRWVQLPINLSMPEALTQPTQLVSGEAVSLVEAARRLGLFVVASGSIAQGQLAAELPAEKGRAPWPPELPTNAQRALQFTRSAAGVTSALVGMSRTQHVRENLAVTRVPKLNKRN